jgi:hypothetical protein
MSLARLVITALAVEQRSSSRERVSGCRRS